MSFASRERRKKTPRYTTMKFDSKNKAHYKETLLCTTKAWWGALNSRVRRKLRIFGWKFDEQYCFAISLLFLSFSSSLWIFRHSTFIYYFQLYVALYAGSMYGIAGKAASAKLTHFVFFLLSRDAECDARTCRRSFTIINCILCENAIKRHRITVISSCLLFSSRHHPSVLSHLPI